jgi:uncharacterized protein (DUF983 family)
MTPRPPVSRVARRAIALRCPRCGETPLFQGWFRMRPACGLCGLQFERAQGYFVGAIYVNYAATTVIALAGFFLLWPRTDWPMAAHVSLWGAFAVVFPLWFFRYSRSLWLAVEYFINPEP